MSDMLETAGDPVLFAQKRLGFDPDEWQKRTAGDDGAPCPGALQSRKSARRPRPPPKPSTRQCMSRIRSTIIIAPNPAPVERGVHKVSNLVKGLEPLVELDEDNRLSLTLRNGSRILSLPGDNPSTVRGYSAPRLIIEDEAAFVRDETHTALRPMLAASPRGQLIVMSTPFGRRGHFFDAWQSGGDVWQRISITAPECSRISPEWLEAERAQIGDWRFRQEYLCEFVETTDQLFSYDLVQAPSSDEIEPLFTGAELAAIAGGA